MTDHAADIAILAALVLLVSVLHLLELWLRFLDTGEPVRVSIRVNETRGSVGPSAREPPTAETPSPAAGGSFFTKHTHKEKR
jgi:hypothetical protein